MLLSLAVSSTQPLPATIVSRANVETKGRPPVSMETDLERRDDSDAMTPKDI